MLPAGRTSCTHNKRSPCHTTYDSWKPASAATSPPARARPLCSPPLVVADINFLTLIPRHSTTLSNLFRHASTESSFLDGRVDGFDLGPALSGSDVW